jgi:hypothetical protein
MRLRIRQALDAAIVSAYQAHARRREKVAAKQQLREVPPEEFGECRLCGFSHLRPLERTVCPACGGDVCRGEPVCGCGASDRGGEYNALATERPATPGQVPRPVATYSLRVSGGTHAAKG